MSAAIEGLILGFLSLFAFGTIGFWFLLVICTLVMLGIVEGKNSLFATFLAIFTVIFVTTAGAVSLSWISENKLLFTSYVVGYFVTGGLWSIFKWWRYNSKILEEYEGEKRRFLRSRSVDGDKIPEGLKPEWKAELNRNRDFNVGKDGIVPPDSKNFFEKIYNWITFWPWSMLAYVFDEPLKKIVRGIHRIISNTLKRISEYTFRETREDF